jgi:hypothetical protein
VYSSHAKAHKRGQDLAVMARREGDRLDAADRAAYVAADDGVTPGDFDYEDADGHLQHRPECPYCIFNDQAAEYFGALREAMFSRLKKIRSRPLPKTLAGAVARSSGVFKALLDARARRDLLRKAPRDFSTERERCDAAVAEEEAEIMMEIMRNEWCVVAARVERDKKRAADERAAGIVRHYPHRKPKDVPNDKNRD